MVRFSGLGRFGVDSPSRSASGTGRPVLELGADAFRRRPRRNPRPFPAVREPHSRRTARRLGLGRAGRATARTGPALRLERPFRRRRRPGLLGLSGNRGRVRVERRRRPSLEPSGRRRLGAPARRAAGLLPVPAPHETGVHGSGGLAVLPAARHERLGFHAARRSRAVRRLRAGGRDPQGVDFDFRTFAHDRTRPRRHRRSEAGVGTDAQARPRDAVPGQGRAGSVRRDVRIRSSARNHGFRPRPRRRSRDIP